MLRDNGSDVSSGGGNGTIGIPSDTTYADGFFNYWTSNYTCSNAFDDINELLLKLLPSKPLDLSMIPLQFNNTYVAREELSAVIHDPCTDDTTPRAFAENFYDGTDGDLSCDVDTIIHGIITLTAVDDTGLINDFLLVTDDSDPYFGQAGKEGFWFQLSADITPTAPLSFARHDFAMHHSKTGTAAAHIWVDNPITATINTPASSLPALCSRYISGVPSLEVADIIGFTSQLLHAVGKHYHINFVATINSPQTSLTQFDPAVSPAENSIVNISDNVTVNNNVYSENITLNVVPYNSKEACAATNHPTGARVDTVSTEVRVRSGSGQYPSNGITNADFGDVYNSNSSIKTIPYDTELQLLNGRFQRPTGDYTGNLPTAGPDYTTGMGTAMRYVTFESISIVNKSGLNIVFNNTAGTWSGVETSGIEINVKVEGSTGWLDANLSYPGVGSPVNDGDLAMVFASSTSTVKRVTFGPTPRSGVVYIRIGIPNGSDKQFGDLTVTEV